ncbi:hypothetical protein JRQ81_018765, partial [Phrynocephalus forsythii]
MCTQKKVSGSVLGWNVKVGLGKNPSSELAELLPIWADNIGLDRARRVPVSASQSTVCVTNKPTKLVKILGIVLCELIIEEWRAYTLARCNAIPSAVLYGRFNRTAYNDRCCACALGGVESHSHMVLYCPLYDHFRKKLLDPLLLKKRQSSDTDILRFLLSSGDTVVIENVASFLAQL